MLWARFATKWLRKLAACGLGSRQAVVLTRSAPGAE